MPKRGRNKRKAPRGNGRSKAAVTTPGAFYKTEKNNVAGAGILSPVRALGGFPDRLRTTVRYCQVLALTSTTGAVVTYAFRGNGAWDPNRTGTGGQPANWDDLALHYLYYRVHASRFSVVVSNGSNTNVPGHFALVPNNGVTYPTADPLQYAAQPYSLYGVVANTSAPLTLTGRMATTRIMGITNAQMLARDALAGATNTLPVDQWDWLMAWQAIDGTSTLIAQCVIVLDYDIEFFEREPGDLDTLFKRQMARKEEFSKRREMHEQHDEKKLAWSDVDDSDEATYAEFLAWKQRAGTQKVERTAGGLTGPEPASRTPTSTLTTTLGSNAVPCKTRVGVG